MPLYKAAPLCSFKYTRDTISSATFKYDTTPNVYKDQTKELCGVTEVCIIDKIKDLHYIYKHMPNIDKDNTEQLLYSEDKVISKETILSLEDQLKEMNITQTKELGQEENLLFKENTFALKLREVDINIETLRPLAGYESEILIEEDRNLKSPDTKEINTSHPLFCDIADTPQIEIKESTFLSTGELTMGKLNSIALGLLEAKLNKINSLYCELPDHTIINREADKGLSAKNILIDKSENASYLKNTTIRHIDKNHKTKLMYLFQSRNINIRNSYYSCDDITEKTLGKDLIRKNVYRIGNNLIEKKEPPQYLNRKIITHMSKDSKGKLLYIDTVKTLSKAGEKQVTREVLIPLFKTIEKYHHRENKCDIVKSNLKTGLSREAITHISKDKSKYLNHSPIRNIYKQLEKNMSNISIPNISIECDKYLKGQISKDIYIPRDTKFIEITKRWWWLNPTNPRDKLIVPNKDYEKMKDLLSNPEFEYLRYNHHPIEWGEDWGIDWKIPPYAVSIEIMLDLINIIIMVWHKNTQGWLSVTGKESIQLLMELLYDWYSMETSKPNQDYYRAYRWIRWEAEKVYFLSTENGLQAIGMLVGNLLDYMRIHHFNVVPVWRNPKAMDEERSFNKKITNGDLMKVLDKAKGNRHYMIETQNFEKKDITRR